MNQAGTFKMEEEKEKSNETNKVVGIGLDMLELIKRVRKNFKLEYGFEPSIVHITNLIAKRVNDNNLF